MTQTDTIPTTIQDFRAFADGVAKAPHDVPGALRLIHAAEGLSADALKDELPYVTRMFTAYALHLSGEEQDECIRTLEAEEEPVWTAMKDFLREQQEVARLRKEVWSRLDDEGRPHSRYGDPYDNFVPSAAA